MLSNLLIRLFLFSLSLIGIRYTLKESFKLRVSSKLKYYMEFIKNQIISLTINFLIDTMCFLCKNIAFTPRVDTLNLLGYFREYLGRYPHLDYIKNNLPIRKNIMSRIYID